jgi:hypothetical protein
VGGRLGERGVLDDVDDPRLGQHARVHLTAALVSAPPASTLDDKRMPSQEGQQMICKDERDSRCPATSGERRALRAAIAFGAAAALGVGVGIAPTAHAAPVVPTSSAVSTVSTLASVSDPDAQRAALQLLKSTYFNDVDSKNWLALRQLFAPDAVIDTTGSLGPLFPNRDSFIAFTALTLSLINTRHQGYDPQIDLTSDTTASAVWTMQDRLSIAGLVTIHGYGHYADTYEKVNGQWVVSSSKLTRTAFGLELPAVQAFVTGLGQAYESGGAVSALLYVVPGLVNIPVSVVKALVGAVASNFGGPPAKAEPITVPPGSTGATTEPQGVTSSATTATSTTLTVTVPASAATQKSAAANATPLATDTAATAAKADQPIEARATQGAVAGEPRATSVDTTGESPKTPDNTATESGATERAESTTSTSTQAGDTTKPAATSAHTEDKSESTKSTHTKDETDSTKSTHATS